MGNDTAYKTNMDSDTFTSFHSIGKYIHLKDFVSHLCCAANTPIFLDYTNFNPAQSVIWKFFPIVQFGVCVCLPEKIHADFHTTVCEHDRQRWTTTAASMAVQMNVKESKKHVNECHDIKLSQSQSTLID